MAPNLIIFKKFRELKNIFYVHHLLKGSKLLNKIWPHKCFFVRQASYHFKA